MNIMQQMIGEVCADIVLRLLLGHVFDNLTGYVVKKKTNNYILSLCFRRSPEYGGLSFPRN